MRREDIQHGAGRLSAALQAAQAVETARELAEAAERGEDKRALSKLMAAYDAMTEVRHALDAPANDLFARFSAPEYLDRAWWRRQFDRAVNEGARPAAAQWRAFAQTLQSLSAHMPKLAALMDADPLTRLARAGRTVEAGAYGTVTFYFREKADDLSALRRYGEAIAAIERLHGAIAEIETGRAFEASLADLDAGADPAVTILTAAKVAEALIAFLAEVWGRVKYVPDGRYAAALEAAGGGFAILSRLNGSIEPERAERFKRQLTEAARSLLDLGVYIEAMNGLEDRRAATLLEPPSKRLAFAGVNAQRDDAAKREAAPGRTGEDEGAPDKPTAVSLDDLEKVRAYLKRLEGAPRDEESR